MTKNQLENHPYAHENGSYSNDPTENSDSATRNCMTNNPDYDVKEANSSASQDHDTRPLRTSVTTVTHFPPPIPKPDIATMKRNRVRNQTLGGWIGGAFGFLVLWIPGAIIGAIAGNKLTKHHLKKEERQALEEYEYRVAQLNALQSNSTVQSAPPAAVVKNSVA